MKTILKNIVQIKSGFYRKIDISGDTIYLQVSDFTETGDLKSPESLAKDLKFEPRLEKHLLRDDDILVAANGERNFSLIYRQTWGPAVASSSFFIIRIPPEMYSRILPEYSLWFLKHPVTLSKIKRRAKGSNLPSVSKDTLENLEIPVPALEQQKKIIRISDLCETEKRITLEILNKKSILYQSLLIDFAKHQAARDLNHGHYQK